MRQALLIVDVQPCFAPPDWLSGISSVIIDKIVKEA